MEYPRQHDEFVTLLKQSLRLCSSVLRSHPLDTVMREEELALEAALLLLSGWEGDDLRGPPRKQFEQALDQFASQFAFASASSSSFEWLFITVAAGFAMERAAIAKDEKLFAHFRR